MMADDITLTVRVRDLSRGDFNRLDRQLDRMRRDLRGVSRDGATAGMHARRLGVDLNNLQQRFLRIQQTGSLTRRELTQLRGVLDAMSRSALNAARSGEITRDRYHSLSSEINSLRAQFAYLGRGLDDNTNALRRNSNQTTHTVRMVNGLVRSVNSTTRTTQGNTRVINTWNRALGDANNSLRTVGRNGTLVGKTFGNMRAKLIGVAAVLIASLLPTIGALAPMLAGIGSIAGVAALAFSGLRKPTKQLSKDEKDFLAALKPVTKEFRQLQKTASSTVLPKVARSFKDVKNVIKSLNPVIEIAGDAFGTLVQKIARGLGSEEFMGPFLKNVKMGSKWVLDFAGSIGKFTTAFFDFGTKSQKALDAWQNLLGGFLDRGLPSMFKNMETGISGSSDWLNGLAFLINDSLLPSLGKMIAGFMKAFGPLLEQTLRMAGGAFNNFANVFGYVMDAISPLTNAIADILKGLLHIGEIGSSVGASLFKSLSGALGGTLSDLGFKNNPFSALQDGWKGFSEWVQRNQGTIRSAFIAVAQSIVTMVEVGVAVLPKLTLAFSTFSKLAIEAIDVVVSMMAATWGKVPGPVGKMFRDMNTNFDKAAEGWKDTLDGMQGGIEEFAKAAGPNLSRAHLTLNVDQAKANLTSIKAQLQDPELTKERKAKLTADKHDAEEKLRKAELALAAFDGKRGVSEIEANNAPFFGKLNAANRAKLNPKSTTIKANPSPFWSTVGGIAGRILGTSYINVKMRRVEETNAPPFRAAGGPIRLASGGSSDSGGGVYGPGTSTSDSIPAMLSNGEYVIRASSVQKYGQGFLDSVNRGTLKMAAGGFAKGGMSQSTKDARKALTSSFGISYFGRMAGYQRTPFTRDLGAPRDVNSLVSTLNALSGNIKRAFSGRTEAGLLSQLGRAGKSLITYEKKLTDVNKRLDAAKDKLSGLKDAAAQMRDSIKSNIIGEANITRSATAEDSRATINTILSQSRADTAQAQEFASALATLKNRGVSANILEQIASAGVQGGGLETAQALLGASTSQLKELNSLNTNLIKAADSAGATAANAMYAAGIKAAEGLVAGLTKQKKAIETAMLSIAKSMEKAIKKALGIRSPSRVMQSVGHYTAEGFALGVKKNQNISRSWESMLTVPGGTTGTPSTTGNSNQPIVIQLSIGNNELGEIIIDPLRRSIRRRGGNVQAVLGK